MWLPEWRMDVSPRKRASKRITRILEFEGGKMEMVITSCTLRFQQDVFKSRGISAEDQLLRGLALQDCLPKSAPPTFKYLVGRLVGGIQDGGNVFHSFHSSYIYFHDGCSRNRNEVIWRCYQIGFMIGWDHSLSFLITAPTVTITSYFAIITFHDHLNLCSCMIIHLH